MEIAHNSIEIEVHEPNQSIKNAPQQPPQDQEDEYQSEEHASNKPKIISISSPQQPLQDQEDEGQQVESTEKTIKPEPKGFSKKQTRLGRLGIFLVVIGLLIMGRFSVPDNQVACIEDKVLEGLKAANDFINKPQNDAARRIMQALCSFLIDVVFIGTFIYWIFKGNSWRLPLTLGIFYLVRIFVQKFWFSPFPSGFIWDDPGVPSLVVPYGRGSDFFYSGHTGFVTICAREWHVIGSRSVRNFVILVGIYTIMILMIYRVHYSIDIFTGLFFSDWCFLTIDSNKEFIDSLWLKVTLRIREVITNLVKKK